MLVMDKQPSHSPLKDGWLYFCQWKSSWYTQKVVHIRREKLQYSGVL